MKYHGLIGLAAISMLAAMDGVPRKRPRPRQYDELCGPPYPSTRQQRRAMLREAAKPIRKKSARKGTPS